MPRTPRPSRPSVRVRPASMPPRGDSPRGRRVLIVEDSAAARALLQRLLKQHGWEVTAAIDAESGAVQALASPPDAIVTDVWMTGLSGLQLCRLMREHPSTAHVPIVLLTASSDRRSRFWGAECGANGFVEKHSVAELPALLERLTSGIPPRSLVAKSTAVDERSIPARLGHLLDAALFQSVLATRMRGLALAHQDVPSLFRALGDLLASVFEYRWLALALRGDDTNLTYVQCAVEDREVMDDVTAALMPTDAGSFLLVNDARCIAIARGATETRPVRHAEQTLGTLIIQFQQNPARANDMAALGVIASELGLAVRLVALLELTQRLAMTDALTGLMNRRGAMDALETTVAGAARHGQPLCVALVDIDHFKAVNDRHGHAAGDATLRHVARILQRCARRSDVVARWGGEEFLLILPLTHAAGARVVAERLRAAISMAPTDAGTGTRIDVRVSVGVASFADDTAAALVERADQALYAAKRGGRNRVEISEAPAATTR